MDNENTIQRRFRQSNSVMPEGMVIGSDWSIHPMPGQLSLDLAAETPAFPVGSEVSFTMKLRGRYQTRKAIVTTTPSRDGWFSVRDKRSNIAFAVHPEQHRVKAL